MRIITPSRIHMTLLDLNASRGRMDGGIGLALKEPRIVLRAEKNDRIVVEGPLKDRAREAAQKMLSALGIASGVKIGIEEAYPQHVGLGAGTQIALATCRAIAEIYGANLSVRELAKIVGRGGTSGIGVAAFDGGGFILDGGHSAAEKKEFLPSSASKASPPPLLARYDFPDWKVVLITPRKGEEFSGAKEIDIFQKYCPIPLGEVERVCHVVLMRILPAIVEEDVRGFGEGINMIQRMGFKRIEVELQDRRVRELMELCGEHSFGAGLSSFGPTVYSIVEDEDDLLDALGDVDADIIVTKANNKGATAMDG